MPTATPESLIDVVRAVFVEAQQRAAGEFEDILDQIEAAPEAGWAALKDLVESRPDWSTLLLLILTKIQELDPQHITAGVMHHPEWNRLLTLTYTPDLAQGLDTPVVLGLAVTEPDAAHGILLMLNGDVDKRFGDEDGFHIQIRSNGDQATWEIPFQGSFTMPTGTAVVDVTVSWPPGLSVDDGGVRCRVGPLSLRAKVDTATPGYQVTLGLGDTKTAGVAANIDVADHLGLLSTIVDIAPVGASYSPNVRLGSGRSPSFSLAYPSD